MSRRDTIIVAVLVNTGLLAVLFMMAMHTDITGTVVQTESIAAATAPNPEPVISEAPKIPPIATDEGTYVASRDELDEVLKNYTIQRNTPVVVTPQSRAVNTTVEPAPIKETPKKASPQQKYVDVTVKRGDALEKIARSNGTTVSAVMAANNLPSARIEIGQVLRIPVGQKNETTAAQPQKTTANQQIASSEPEYYTIKSGDNPWKIAKQFHVRFDDLLKLNNLDEGKARNLKPGDVLRVK